MFPYMTANVEFEIAEHHKDVLLVPNAALRWYPLQQVEMVAAPMCAKAMAESKAKWHDPARPPPTPMPPDNAANAERASCRVASYRPPHGRPPAPPPPRDTRCRYRLTGMGRSG